jgi:hypothetical protein
MASVNNLGQPCQIAASPSSAPSITISFTNGTLDPSIEDAALSSISQDLGSIYVSKGVVNSQNLLIQATNGDRNLILNPNFNFDPTILAVNDGAIAGVSGSSVITACKDWTIGAGYFGYQGQYPVTLSNAADPTKFFAVSIAASEENFTLLQSIQYVTLIPNQVYSLSFELKVTNSPPEGAVMQLNINDETNSPNAYFQTTPDGGVDCSNEGPVDPKGALIPINVQDYTNVVVYFRVCESISPTIYIYVDKTITSFAQVYFRNFSLTTVNSGAALGTNGYQVPFPMPTSPSMISNGKNPSDFIKAWDFSTPENPGQSILDWLSKLGSAVQDPVSKRWVGGLFCLNQKDSNYTNLAIATDTIDGKTQQVLQVTANANNIIG